jgi:hypothetical protein
MMRKCSAFLIPLILFFVTPCVNASITSYACNDDSDGAIVMGPNSLTLDGSEYVLSIDCTQNWHPGHIEGDFTATPEDPIVRFIEDISNDTTFAWTDYHITIGMNNSTFSILSTGLLAPAGWTANVTAVAPGQIPNGGGSGYVGSINYVMSTGGSPIAISDTGTFGFKISFTGSTAFSMEQVPTPEPTTIALLGLGGLALIRRRRA